MIKQLLGNIFYDMKDFDSLLSILDSINDGILIVDVNDIICYINPEYMRITASPNIIGEILSKARPGAILPKVVRTGRAVSGVMRVVDDIEYVVNLAPIYHNGLIVGGVSTVRGIEEIKELHEFVKTKMSQVISKSNRKKTDITFENILGSSPAIMKAKEFAFKVGQNSNPLLITGESGTGKEIFAQAVHSVGDRANRLFVAVNCASLPSSLIETELFGYVGGAFTGAHKDGRLGLFQMADGGTLFLDEIAELDMTMQAKLLRVLQENKVRMIGDYEEKPVDVRIIAASNKNLDEMAAMGLFRKDLLYRLNVLHLHLPPLHERNGDTLFLAEYLLDGIVKKTGQPIIFSAEVKNFIANNTWNGNVRELKNFVEYMSVVSDSIITLEHVKIKYPFVVNEVITLTDFVKKQETAYIESLLLQHGSDLKGKKAVASLLGISLATLYNKL